MFHHLLAILTFRLATGCADTRGDPTDVFDSGPPAAQSDGSREDAATVMGRDLDARVVPDAPVHGDASVDQTQDGGVRACVDALSLPLLREPPATLADTGIYLSGSADPREFAPYARPFQPQFELWSDGATKQRLVYLPACTRVDTSEMDYWKFPVGTRFWKEFRKDGTLLETRFIHRYGPGEEDWLFATYAWDLSEPVPSRALLVEDGAQNVNGTQHDIPSLRDCRSCHINLPEPPLAFGALQLSHSLPGETLSSLTAAGWLTDAPPSAGYAPPGDETARAALGYLHANCGHCHNSYYRTLGNSLPNDPAPRMRLSVHDWSVERTTTYRTLVAVGTFNPSYRDYSRIEPCNPHLSSVLLRMELRTAEQMPPLATETVHQAGVDLVRRFLQSLHGPSGGTCPTPSSAAWSDG